MRTGENIQKVCLLILSIRYNERPENEIIDITAKIIETLAVCSAFNIGIRKAVIKWKNKRKNRFKNE